MWNTVTIVFSVSLVVVSFLFLPFSIACLILLTTSGIVLVHELQWNLNVPQLKNWFKSCFECVMDNKSTKSKPFPRVLNSNGVTKNHSPLMTNKYKASPNLTPQSKLSNEPIIVNDVYKMSLDDRNRHSTPINLSGSRNYRSDKLEDERNSWSNIKSKDQSVTGQKNVQTVAGPLLVSTRFNSNISSELSANASSAGFSSRLAQKGAEMAAASAVTHQSKYAGIGVFPVVQLHSRSPKHHIGTPVLSRSAKAVRVRIAPPDNSPLCGNMDHSDFSNVNEGEDSVKSVLQVLKEISRKRIHSQVDEDGDESVKRPKKDRIEENLNMSLDPAVQNKRGREDSPRSSEEVKRQRRHVNGASKSSNEIMSSLSSSVAVRPPHLCPKSHHSKATKRKAHAVDWSRCSTPVSGKVLKVHTSPNQDQDQVAKPSKYQDNRPLANQVDQQDNTSGGGASSHQQQPSGMVRIEAGGEGRRLLARGAGTVGGGALLISRVGAEAGAVEEDEEVMTSSRPAEAAELVANGPLLTAPSTRGLLKQMADPGQRLKDMLAAINGDDDVSTEEATMSPNVVAILKSAKSTLSTSPSDGILKTSVHSDAHKTVSFAQPLTSFSESSLPSTSLLTDTTVNNSITSADVGTAGIKSVSKFTLPSSASPAATGFQSNAFTSASPNAIQSTAITPSAATDAPSSSTAFTLQKSDDNSRTNSPLFSADNKITGAKPENSSSFVLNKDAASLNSTLFGAKAVDGSGSSVEKSSTPVFSSAPAQPTFSFGSKTNEAGAKPGETSATSLFGGTTKAAESPSTSLLGAKPAESSAATMFGGTKSAESPAASPFGTKPAESIFGAKPAESSTASPFGTKPAESSAASIFGAKPAESSAASGFGAKPAELSAASAFGAKPAESSSATLFGAKPAETVPSTIFGASTSSSLFNPQAKSNEMASSSAAAIKSITSPPAFGNSSLFGGGTNTTTSSANTIFGASNNAATSSAPNVFGGSSNVSTPPATTAPAFGCFGNTSTTAGAPPMFGATAAATASSSAPNTTSSSSSPALNLFGGTVNSDSNKNLAAPTTTASAGGSLFTGTTNKTFGSSSTTASAPPSIFGAAAPSSGSTFGSAFGGTTSKQQHDSGFGSTFGSSATPLFGGSTSDAAGKTNGAFSSASGAAAPMFGAAATSTTPSSSAGGFGGTGFGQPSGSAGFGGSSSTTANSPAAFGGGGFNSTFGSKPAAQPTTTASAFGQPSSSLFSFGGQSPATTTQSSSMFNGVAQTASTALTNGGFGVETKSFGNVFNQQQQQPAAPSSSAAPAFSFGAASSGSSGGAFAFGAATSSNNNNNNNAVAAAESTSAFNFSKSTAEQQQQQPSKPFAFGGASSSSGSTTANQPSAFAFNSGSSSTAAGTSAGFQFNAASPAQPQVPGAFVFGGASTSNSGFGMNPPAFTLGAGGGAGVPGAAAGARFSIGSGSTSARSRSVARAKRTK